VRRHNGSIKAYMSLGTIMEPLACLLAFLLVVLLLLLLQTKNIKIKIYRTIICPLFYTGVKVGLTLREEHRLRVLENRVLRKIDS
jgi:MFS superfamily sulfate permease-like transporter